VAFRWRASLAAAEASAAVEAALELPQSHEGTQTVNRASRAAEWEAYSTNNILVERVCGWATLKGDVFYGPDAAEGPSSRRRRLSDRLNLVLE
jgi:hypothetical protein